MPAHRGCLALNRAVRRAETGIREGCFHTLGAAARKGVEDRRGADTCSAQRQEPCLAVGDERRDVDRAGP